MPALVLVLAATAMALTACRPPGGPRVLILGESLTIESKGAGDAAILAGYQVDWSGVKYMTAPCNGLAVAKKLTYVPDVVWSTAPATGARSTRTACRASGAMPSWPATARTCRP